MPPLTTKHQDLVKSIKGNARDADNKEDKKTKTQTKDIPDKDTER